MEDSNIISNKKYGDLVVLSSGEVQLKVTKSIGPRIIYFGIDENLFYEDDDYVTKEVSSFSKEFKKGAKWHLYGGHRLWRAPEDNLTYYPDNEDVKYFKQDEWHVFQSQLEKSTKLEKQIKIKAVSDYEWEVLHVITNKGNSKVDIAVWGLTVCKPSGYVYIPFSTKKTGYLPNRNIVVWEYTDIHDNRLKVNNNCIVVKIEKEEVAKCEPLKVGTYVENARIYYLKDNILFEKTYTTTGRTLDLSSNIEVYTTNRMVELESLSSMKRLEKNQSVEHKETWKLYKKGSDLYKEIHNMVKKEIKVSK